MRAATTVLTAAGIALLAACNSAQRDKIDSAAGSADTAIRSALAVVDVDFGRHADSAKNVTDKTDTFAPKDTIFASVLTSGTASNEAIAATWTFPDSSVVNQTADAAAMRDHHLVFFIAKPAGLAKGTYTFRVLVNDREVRSKDVTVQ